MSSVSTTNISGTDNDFGRPSGTGVFLYCYPGTSYLATIMLSLRDKIHSPAEALLKLTLMGCAPARPALYVSTLLLAVSSSALLRYRKPARVRWQKRRCRPQA